MREQAILRPPQDGDKALVRAQKGLDVFHSCKFLLLIRRLHERPRSMLRARRARQATGRRNRVWLRALVLLGVIGGIPGRPKSPLAWVTPGVVAVDSPGQLRRASQQNPGPTEPAPPTPLSKKQKKDLLKDNFEKMKRDADELAELAKSLQEDLDKSNENVLSLRVVDRAEKIEKLAKRIKGMARGY